MYRKLGSEGWIDAKVHSRAGKATGKYGSRWNVKANNKVSEIDISRVEWKEVPSDTQETFCSFAYLSHVDKQTLDAKNAELENWKREDVYTNVDDQGQAAMSSRWVITPKLMDNVLSTKARLVARGFEEDSNNLRTDSPTCMRESLKLTLCIAISNGWAINSIDIKAAFLQGLPISREVFLRPPKEANAAGKLWLLKKAVYGLSDASRVWYMRVVEELSKLGMTKSKLDGALFVWKYDGVVQGLIVAHVDDFLWCGSPMFYEKVILNLKQSFKISKENHDSFRYIGVDLQQTTNKVIIGQRQYIDGIPTIDVGRVCGLEKNSKVDDGLRKQYRGLVGQLNWASGMSRPDASFNACVLSTKQSAPNLSDLREGNKAVRDLKGHHVELNFPLLDLSSVKIVTFADASYANLDKAASQVGHIIFLCDKRQNCAPISWSSTKCRRVVRSTLGAETLAAVEAADSSIMCMRLLEEVLGRKRGEIRIELHTDNKSLYDALSTSNMLTDKRLRVDMAALREMNDKGEIIFRWISSSNQLADVLTKRGSSKQKLLDVLRTARLDA